MHVTQVLDLAGIKAGENEEKEGEEQGKEEATENEEGTEVEQEGKSSKNVDGQRGSTARSGCSCDCTAKPCPHAADKTVGGGGRATDTPQLGKSVKSSKVGKTAKIITPTDIEWAITNDENLSRMIKEFESQRGSEGDREGGREGDREREGDNREDENQVQGGDSAELQRTDGYSNPVITSSSFLCATSAPSLPYLGTPQCSNTSDPNKVLTAIVLDHTRLMVRPAIVWNHRNQQ